MMVFEYCHDTNDECTNDKSKELFVFIFTNRKFFYYDF